MSRNRQRVYIAVLIVGFLVCIGVIWFLNFMQSNDATTDILDSEKTQRDVSGLAGLDSKSIGSQHLIEPNSASNSLSNDLIEPSNSDEFDYKRALLNFVNGATEEELVDEFRDSLVNSTLISTFNATPWKQSVVLTRLIKVNSEKAQSLIEQLDERAAKSVVYSVMREWNRIHKNEAIELLVSFEPQLRSLGLRGIIDGGNRFLRSDLVDIGRKLGFEEIYVNRILDHSQTVQAQISWDDLETEFKNIELNDSLGRILLARKAASYVRFEGLDSLSAVLEMFDSLDTDHSPQMVRTGWNYTRSRLVAEIAQDDPQAVFEYVMQLGEDIDLDLLSAVSEVWFATDPGAIWNRLNSPDLKDVQEDITTEIIRAWSSREPETALISLEEFPKKYHDRVYLQIAEAMSRDSPLEALELLPLTSGWFAPKREDSPPGGFSIEDSLRSFKISLIVSTAAGVDPIATIEWINSEEAQLHDSAKQEHLDSVFGRWTGSDPAKAFEMALQSPLQDGEAGTEAAVVRWLSFQNVDRAIELLPRVREGETKVDAYRSVARQLEEQDRITEAFQIGMDLPEHDREQYNQSIAWMVGMRATFDHLLGGVRRLPTGKLQSEAAKTALMFTGTKMSNELTDQQVIQLKEFLSVDDKLLVEMILDEDLNDVVDKLP